MWHDGWGPGAWVVMGLFMVVFWGLVVAAIVALVGMTRGHDARGDDSRRDDALRILDERFARGEIDADEYSKRRDLLRTR